MAGVDPSTEPRSEYTLHRLAWSNSYQQLDERLKKKLDDKEELDPHGRTPLMLSVTLGHLESTRVLLQHGTNVNVINKGGWTVVQEAVATGDPELLQFVLERRDKQRYTSRVGGIPDLLQKLKSAPDFYVEMKWEFTSWVPFLSRICPSDTYKVYKQGSSVRIDTTLLGFDQTNWVRGDRTYVFQGRENGADLYEIDHDTRTVYCEEMKILSLQDLETHVQNEEQISARLVNPLVLTYVDTDKIMFERSRSGIWGWGGEKSEAVSGYSCKVFDANNVELNTKTRTEHLTEEDKKRAKSNKNPLQSFLGMAEVEVKQSVEADTGSEFYSVNNPCCISPEEYFGGEDLGTRDIGRPKEMTCKLQKFQAQMWLSEEYPLSLQEQVMPIVDLMAISNSHFQKLKDFITCSFPAGFPVKIEIPLFHVLNARITFGNIFGLTKPVDGIQALKEDESRTSCVIDEEVFRIPEDYSRMGGQSSDQVRRQHAADDDDQLLQYAIRQSVSENGSVITGGLAGAAVATATTATTAAAPRVPEQNAVVPPSPTEVVNNGTAVVADDDEREEVSIWEALQGQGPTPTSNPSTNPAAYAKSLEDRHMELQIQKAIELSLNPDAQQSDGAGASGGSSGPDSKKSTPDEMVTSKTTHDPDLMKVIEMSQKEEDSYKKKQEEEDETLQRILALSMEEK